MKNINKALNINKIVNYNYDIMAKSRYGVRLNFLKNYVIWSYLGVTLSTCNIQDLTFILTKLKLLCAAAN